MFLSAPSRPSISNNLDRTENSIDVTWDYYRDDNQDITSQEVYLIKVDPYIYACALGEGVKRTSNPKPDALLLSPLERKVSSSSRVSPGG